MNIFVKKMKPFKAPVPWKHTSVSAVMQETVWNFINRKNPTMVHFKHVIDGTYNVIIFPKFRALNIMFTVWCKTNLAPLFDRCVADTCHVSEPEDPNADMWRQD